MISQNDMRKSVDWNFSFQNGMYLDGKKQIQGANIYFSNYILDHYWNYAIDMDTNNNNVELIVNGIEETMLQMKRKPAFYITPWTNPKDKFINCLTLKGYKEQFQDAWMFYVGEGLVETKALSISLIDLKEDADIFCQIFGAVYGGSPTVNEPYGGLPPSYLEALRQSFSRKSVETYHFVGRLNGQPVSIATLVYKDGWGAIYNVGTLPELRGKGLGSEVSLECINFWKKKNGQILFLQTEAGSGVEKFYTKLGFKTHYVGACWS